MQRVNAAQKHHGNPLAAYAIAALLAPCEGISSITQLVTMLVKKPKSLRVDCSCQKGPSKYPTVGSVAGRQSTHVHTRACLASKRPHNLKIAHKTCVPFTQAAEDGDGLVDAGRLDQHLLEPPLQRLVLLDVPAMRVWSR